MNDLQPTNPDFPWTERSGFTGHWLKRAYIAMRRQLETELRKRGLTHSQWAALGMLYYKSGMTHSELEQALYIEAPSLTSLVKGMEKRGWVERRQHPEDARVKQIFLTDQGRQVIEPALALGQQGEQKLTEIFTEQELEQVKRVLRRIVEHLEQ